MIVSAEKVTKSFSESGTPLEILRGVSLKVEKPETVAIMGRSGCGKSTFISILAGLDQPTGGEVNILGRELSGLSSAELNRFRARHIGIVFQQFHLLGHLTALENVRLPLDLNRVEGADEKAKEMLRKVGLGHRENHFPDKLSRGECQRVAIARVLVMKPEVLLADEPTGSLDVKTGREVIDLIFNLVETEKIALVMATHDPKVAERCSKILYMDAGVLSSERPPTFG
ncbi:MAG TPA: ABC transporter ATP-binding protein [Bdellovibrionales bacterium]|nr:ABC transporter ATP-binding protein [Bdellovibrionales bacterium]